MLADDKFLLLVADRDGVSILYWRCRNAARACLSAVMSLCFNSLLEMQAAEKARLKALEEGSFNSLLEMQHQTRLDEHVSRLLRFNSLLEMRWHYSSL